LTLASLFDPRSIAVVGASPEAGKAGNAMLRALETFPGTVVPINPRRQTIDGRDAFPSVAAAPEHIDLAILCVPAEALLGAIRDCADAGVSAAMVCTGGLAESGPRGAALEADVAATAAAGGMRLLGPNTSGFLRPSAGLCASFVTSAAAVSSGNVAVVAQSGGVNLHLAFALLRCNLGVSLAVGLGNAVDVGAADVVDHLALDDETHIVLLALEGVSDGERLCAAIARTVEQKPVLVLKVGTEEHAEFARSHTGALAGNDAVARAALRQAGAVLVDSTEELLAAARLLTTTRLEPKRVVGAGVVSGQAGPALILADALTRAGLSLPELSAPTRARVDALLPPLTYTRNPVDTGRPGSQFGDVVEAVARDDAVDALLVYAIHEPDAVDAAAVLPRVRGATGIPVVFVTNGPRDAVAETVERLGAAGVPTYTTPEAAVAAVRALAADAAARARLRRRVPSTRTVAPIASLARIDEAVAKDILEGCGIRTPRREVHADRTTVPGVLERLHAPLVAKMLDADVAHKSELGGVRTGLFNDADLLTALDAIDTGRGGQGWYLIEEQAPAGTELIVGARRDPSFGPVVMLGLGGIAAEAFADVSFRRVPVDADDVGEMIESLRAARLFDGFRGLAPVDRHELSEVIAALGDLIATNAWIAEIDINPLRATPTGLLALDAMIAPTL
jgi:acyl-CoA synthetase (NDP forming)